MTMRPEDSCMPDTDRLCPPDKTMTSSDAIPAERSTPGEKSLFEQWKCEDPTHTCGQMEYEGIHHRCEVFRKTLRALMAEQPYGPYTKWWDALKEENQ